MMRSFLTLIVAAVLWDCALAAKGSDRPPNENAKNKTIQFKFEKTPGQLRSLLAKAKVKVNGRELQFFTESMLVDLQKALHDLRECRTKPNGKARKFSVEETPFSIETDVIPLLEQVQDAIAACEADKNPNSARHRRRRQILGNESRFWATDRTIKIVLSDHAATQATNVKRFFDVFVAEMTKKTCLQLELVDSPPRNEPYVLVITELSGDYAGCWTYAGRANGAGHDYVPHKYKDDNAHPIFISQGCWEYEIIAHEFLHALGLYHEQSRADRFNFIDIHWDNIPEKYESQYGDCSPWGCKVAVNTYDPISVMHYTPTTFAADKNKPTISPKSYLSWDNLMGTAVDLSYSDYYRINDMYCKAACPNADCGKGYPNPHDCNQCFCPDGIGQGNCDEPVPDFLCGGILESGDEWKLLNLTDTVNTPEPNQCNWVLQAPNSGKVQLQTSNSTMTKTTSVVQPCYWAAFEVRTTDFDKATSAYCGSEVSERSYESAGDKLMAIYRYNLYKTNTQFTVYYRTKPGSEQTPPSTTTTEPEPTVSDCPTNYFYCEHGTPWLYEPPTYGNCIHNDWLCDGYRDCRYNAEDEDPVNC